MSPSNPFYLLIPIALLFSSFTTAQNSYDDKIYNRAKVFVDKLERRYDKLENRWVRQFEDKVTHNTIKVTRQDLINSAKAFQNDFRRHQDAFKQYENWKKLQDTNARDSFRRNVYYLLTNAINQSWRTQLKEAWYRIRAIEHEFFSVDALKHYDKNLDSVRKPYKYYGKEHDAAVASFNKKVLVIEKKARAKALKEYKAVTQELLDRRRELVAASWGWVDFISKLGNQELALAMKKNLYTEFAADLRGRHKPVHKELSIDFFTRDSTLDLWHRNVQPQDLMFLRNYVLPRETPYSFKMNDDFLAERVDAIQSVTLDDKARTYQISSVKVDDLPWFQSYSQLKQNITDTRQELEFVKEYLQQTQQEVKQLKESQDKAKKAQAAFLDEVKQAQIFLQQQKNNYPPSLKYHLQNSRSLQQQVDAINVLIRQLDENEHYKELLKLAEQEKSLLKRKAVSDKFLKESRAKDTLLQEKIAKAESIVDGRHSKRIQFNHQLRILGVDLKFAQARLAEDKALVQQLEASLKPMLNAEKAFAKTEAQRNSKGSLVNYVAVFADNKLRFSAYRYAPGSVLNELENEIEKKRKQVQFAKQGLTRSSAEFTSALEYTRAELAQLARVIMGSAYAQTAIETADFIYDVLKANEKGGPPAALIEAVYKLAEQRYTGSSTIETLSDAEVKDVEKQVQAELNNKIKRSIRKKTQKLPGYIYTRTFEESVGNYAKTKAYQSTIAGWAQTMIRDNRAMSLQELYRKTPNIQQYLKIMGGKEAALKRAQRQLDFLQSPYSIDLKDVKEAAGNYVKDAAKSWAKNIAKNAEHAAWYRYYLADANARALHPVYQEWHALYFDTQDQLNALLKARRDILANYDPKTGFKANLNRTFEQGQVLRASIEVDGYSTDYELFLDTEKAAADGYRKYRIETSFIQSKANKLPLIIKEKVDK
ncbi:hypothetical protein [Pleionea sp. CnH1-48]|uniref:hypothetical protein n=1 Tax=Pleionea sp. CnH1-48 TaxID=2954494 RepID=UPI0020983919|nr:hypothetical protein [Pleionea sp. CnH1-48]MCO7225426.1 hypothetical protein [Pleionea sp. CnH1-48]